MFNYPATEVFNPAGERRVVWSAEQYEAAIASGHTDAPVEPEDPEGDAGDGATGPKKTSKRSK